jgi:hypothetical protein
MGEGLGINRTNETFPNNALRTKILKVRGTL